MTRRVNWKRCRTCWADARRRKEYRALGICVRANNSLHKTLQEFQADGRLKLRKSWNCEGIKGKTSRRFDHTVLILNVTLFFLMCSLTELRRTYVTIMLQHGKRHVAGELWLRQAVSPSLSGSNDVIQWANSNKAEEHPDVQCQAQGSSHPMAATTAMLNHPIKHPSICASQGDGLTKLAWQHLCQPVWKCDKENISFHCQSHCWRYGTDEFCRQYRVM